MEIIIIILSIIVVVLVMVFLFKNHKKTPSKHPSNLNGQNQKSIVNQSERIIKIQVPHVAPDKNQSNITYNKMHPSVRKTQYFNITDHILPATVDDLNREDKIIIEKKISTLPKLPTTTIKLLGLLRNPESNINKITSLVSTNPVFSGKILQTVNSSYFNLPEKITSVGRAITLLGYNNVRAIVFRETVDNTVPEKTNIETDGYTKMWLHSAVVSVCSGHIGKTHFKLSEYELATIGLMHDIGKYFLSSLKDGIEIISDIPSIIKEEHQYGINHSVAGSLVAANWKLPDTIINCIEYHHYPSFFTPDKIPEQYGKQCFIVCLSDLLAHVLGYNVQSEQILPIKDEYFKLYGIEKDIQTFITDDLLKNIEKSNLTVKSYIDVI